MPNTYTELDKVTVATSVPSVTLSSIPQGYTDLVLVSNVRINQSSSSDLYCQPNGVGTANKGFTFLIGNGSTATSNRGTNDANIRIGAGTGTSQASGIFATSISNFMGYSNTTTFKTILSRGSDATNAAQAVVGLFPSTNAITSIVIYGNNSVNILAGSTFSLYGIANADQGAAKATGGIITEDSQYWYHTFGASGTFAPKQSLTADILVVAGGGGASSGAGGAGGVIYFASNSLTATNYNCTVGAGATAQSSGSADGNNGNNSTFGALTAAVGGGGGGFAVAVRNGLAGGSGGGGGSTDTGQSNGGATNQTGTGATAFYGNAGGGNGNFRGAPYPNGGGGGAGAAGTSATSNSIGGNGGDGTSAFSSWGLVTGTGQNVNGTVFYAGGGGGGIYASGGTPGTAGKGGGGAGASGPAGTNGSVNTGGGGGGGNGYPAASGGSGVIIVRYAK